MKGDTKLPRAHIVTMRMDEELHRAAQMVGAVTMRSTSNLLEYALRLYIEKNFPQAFDREAKVVLSLTEAPIERTVL
jgi:hypothetical protein